MVLWIIKLTGARQGAHPCPGLLPTEGKWRRKRIGTSAHSSEVLPAPPAYRRPETASGEVLQREQKGEVKKNVFLTMVRKGQASDEKPGGRRRMTNAVRAVTGRSELDTTESRLPAKIPAAFRGHFPAGGGFIGFSHT